MKNTAKKSNELTEIKGFEPMNNKEAEKINGGNMPRYKYKVVIVVKSN